MRISIGSDHQGLGYKQYLCARICTQSDIVIHQDAGLNRPGDHFAVVSRLAVLLRGGDAERAVLLCTNALGATMYANKQSGIRAAQCHDPGAARDGVRDHNMNLLVMDVAAIAHETASSITDSFLRSAYSGKSSFTGIPPDSLAHVIEHIQNNLDQPLDVAKLAGLIRMSPSYFSKLFKISLGVSPHQFILHARVDRSKELLRNSAARIVDIAFEVGFETQAHFTTVFGNLVGMTPRQFRHRIASGPNPPSHSSLFLVHKQISAWSEGQKVFSGLRASASTMFGPTDVRTAANYEFRRR